MKRRDLIRHLEAHGCELLRVGGNHSVYVNRIARKTSTVPRHREVNAFLVQKICRDLEIERQLAEPDLDAAAQDHIGDDLLQPLAALAWGELKAAAKRDKVPLALNQLVGQAQRVSLPPLGEAYWTGEFHARAPGEMTVDLAEFVGYFMGDGSLHSRGLRFCVSKDDFDVVEHLERLGKSMFGLEAHIAKKRGYVEVAFHSVRLVEWWQACGFAKHEPDSDHAGKGWERERGDALLLAVSSADVDVIALDHLLARGDAGGERGERVRGRGRRSHLEHGDRRGERRGQSPRRRSDQRHGHGERHDGGVEGHR